MVQLPPQAPKIETLEKPRTLPEGAQMSVIYKPEFTVFECSVGELPFHGKIEITFIPDKLLLEFESFDEWLKGFVAQKSMTIEDVATLVANQLYEDLKPRMLEVIVKAETMVHYPAEVRIIK